MGIVPDGVTGAQTDPLRDGSVLLLCFRKLDLGAERLVALQRECCQYLGYRMNRGVVKGAGRRCDGRSFEERGAHTGIVTGCLDCRERCVVVWTGVVDIENRLCGKKVFA